MLLVLQVSNDLAFLHIYSTDTEKVDYAHLGLFLAGIDPSLREGVKITKVAIPSERGARSSKDPSPHAGRVSASSTASVRAKNDLVRSRPELLWLTFTVLEPG